MEPIKLYFDKVSFEGKHGETKAPKKILYNLEKINQVEYDKFTDMLGNNNSGSIYLPTGRFISIATGSLDNVELNMVTIDLEDNPEKTKVFSAMAGKDSDLFIRVCTHIKYQEEYNKFILIEGEIPKL